jgi:ankyrin repeat protein
MCTRSALDAAWTRIFSKGLAPDKEEVLRKLFDDTDCLEKRQFTLLHSLILGIEPGELETELLNSNIQQIDAVDSTGRTPLSWASSRGDIANVQKLLQHGANPNITSICGMSPLHYAVRPASYRCITPLLAAGARVDELTNWLQTPLHNAAAYKDDPQFLEALVDSGADVNARDRDGNTPLGCAALANHAKSAAFLLTCGANIDSQDFKGWTALLDAVDTNNHDVAKLLICEGADTALTLKEGDTVLHRAAERGDVETMDILNNAVSVGVDISARNVHGYRARDLLEKRSYVLQEMREAFERLEMSCLKEAEDKVLGPRAGDESPDEDTDKIQDDERFVDAVEFQIEDYF